MDFLRKVQQRRHMSQRYAELSNVQRFADVPSQTNDEDDDDDDEVGASGENKPTVRTKIPAFVANLERIKMKQPAAVDDTLQPFTRRGRGQPLAGSLRPPSTIGRGRRHMESLEATTVQATTCSVTSNSQPRQRAIGLGRGLRVGSSISAPSIPPPPKNLYSDFVFDRREIDVSNLPIIPHQEAIMSAINNNAVTIIQGSTGCGKSTQVPQFILDDAVQKNVPCNIIVTQPRRIAAITLADRVSKERAWGKGEVVGYQIGLKKVLQETTKILYVTVGVLLEKLINVNDLSTWTHVVLDEVHERSQDMDLCLLIIKQMLLEKHSCPTRLVLMSASAQTDRLCEYFSRYEQIYQNPEQTWADEDDGDIQRKFKPPVLSIDGRQYHVDVYYMDDIAKIIDPKGEEVDAKGEKLIVEGDDNLEDTDWFARRQIVLKKLLLYFDKLEAIQQEGCEMERGSVLVFLPGLSQITDVRDHLVGYRPKDSIMEGSEDEKYRWNIVPLHSSIPQFEQQEVFKAPSSGYRKIILSTNIAESSITVPHVRYVIDFCLTKRLRRTLSNSHFSSLKLEGTSKASCEQRKGRAGRLANGRCYRLLWEDFYEHDMPDFCPAEMQIAPLEHVVLRVKMYKRDPVSMLSAAMDQPDTQDIGLAILTLKEVGALSVARKGHRSKAEDPEDEEFEHRQETHGGCMVENSDYMDGDLTFIGKLLSRLPVDVHIGKLIALGYVFGVLEDTIIIGAGMSGSRSIFKQPFQGEKPENALESYRQKLFYSQVSYSDCFAIRNAYRRFMVFMTSEFRGRREDLDAFCNSNYFDKRAIFEMRDLYTEIVSRLDSINIKPQRDEELPNLTKPVDESKIKDFMLQLAIAGAFYPNYFVRKHCNMVEETAQKMFGERDPKYCVGLGQFPMNKGLLYCAQLEKYYKRLTMKNYEGCKVKIDAHDTKAVVDFSDIQRCDIPMGNKRISTRAAVLPVYLALKAKQIPRLRPYLVEVKETHAVQAALDEIQKQSLLKYQTLSDSYENERILYENHIGYPGLHMQHIKLKVTHVKQCCHFFGIYTENENDLRIIEEIISKYDISNSTKLPLSDIKKNIICLAPKPLPKMIQNTRGATIISKNYARVTLQSRSSNKSERSWRVRYLDYGGSKTVSVEHLHVLPQELRSKNYPYLALECQIAEVQPHSIFRPNGEFSDEDYKMFENKLFRMRYVNLSIYSLVGSCLRVRLEHSLDFLGPHAIEQKEEDLPSQSDHLERLKANRLTQSTRAFSECSEKGNEDLEIIKRCHQMKHTEEEERLYQKLAESVVMIGAVSRDKINVTGPEHPYEIKFYGMTSYTSSKKITISHDSVNSVIIDDQPQCHLDRLLVAGLVNPSPRENDHLNLRHTTLLPNLPGLPSLVAMIFAPVAELRVSPCRTRYVGAVCGLGFDETGHPIHPENDLEIVFDTHFDSRTLVNVNEIRLALNLMLTLDELSINDQNLRKYPTVIADLQERIEQAVEDLFLSRKPVHLVNRMENTNPFLWRLLPSTAFIDNSKEINKSLNSFPLFPCHFSVSGVDFSGFHQYLRALCIGSSVNDERAVDKRMLREFQPRWKEEMTSMLDGIYQELTRMYMNGRGSLSGELERTFICELCPIRPDSSCFGYICTTPMSALTHLFSESHRRSEESIRYQRNEITTQLNSLISQ